MNLAIALTLALGSFQQAHAVDVMHCFASGYAADVNSKLAAHPDITSVTDFNCGAGTPSLDELLTYDAVLFYSDSGFSDPTLLGNVIADYVDAGGTAVEAVFSVGSVSVGGRFSESYKAILSSSQTNCSGGLVEESPGHPLLAGVASFDGGSSGYCAADTTFAPTAEPVASWGSGQGLVATHAPSGAGQVTALGFYPPSSDIRDDFWTSSTDGVQLMANALNYTGGAGGSTSLTVDGACPGPVNIEISGNPGDTFVLVAGDMAGSTIIPGGACAGTELGVESAGVLAKFGPLPDVDGDGVIAMMPDITGGACDKQLQAINVNDCSTSGVVGFGGGGPTACDLPPSDCTLALDVYEVAMDVSPAPACTNMNIAFDGTNYWGWSGGTTSCRMNQWDDGGVYLGDYGPGIDGRSVFTKAGCEGPTYGNGYASTTIWEEIAPGEYAPLHDLTGGFLDSQSVMGFDHVRNLYVAGTNGSLTVDRWSGTDGSYVDTLTLSGGSHTGYSHQVSNSGCYLTFNSGTLYSYDGDTGALVDSATLSGAGVPNYSFSYANGYVFMEGGGGWQGWNVGL